MLDGLDFYWSSDLLSLKWKKIRNFKFEVVPFQKSVNTKLYLRCTLQGRWNWGGRGGSCHPNILTFSRSQKKVLKIRPKLADWQQFQIST